jgi:general secretion pathway protein G
MLEGVKKLGLNDLDRGVREPRSPAPARRFAVRSFAVGKLGPSAFAGPRKRLRGFTLLELMIVISMIMILMAVAVPLYNQSIIQARESVLRSNLSTLRSVISQYTLDKQKAPQSLDDLVTGGYLRQIPVDPMTRQTNWEVVQEEIELAVDQQDPGITDVHSASSASASDGTAYSTW